MGVWDALKQAEAIEFRHGEIRNHKFHECTARDNFPGVLAIDRFQGFKVVTENLACRHADDLGVIDDQ